MNYENKALRGGANFRRKPGPKPGQRHSGQWKPGQSGNPSGRPKKSPEMKDLERRCRESAEDALRFLLDTIEDDDAPRNVRLQAAREVLDRGFGKPVDRQAVLNMSGPAQGAAALTRDQLEAIAAGAFEAEPAQVLEFTGKTPPAGD